MYVHLQSQRLLCRRLRCPLHVALVTPAGELVILWRVAFQVDATGFAVGIHRHQLAIDPARVDRIIGLRNSRFVNPFVSSKTLASASSLVAKRSPQVIHWSVSISHLHDIVRLGSLLARDPHGLGLQSCGGVMLHRTSLPSTQRLLTGSQAMVRLARHATHGKRGPNLALPRISHGDQEP